MEKKFTRLIVEGEMSIYEAEMYQRWLEAKQLDVRVQIGDQALSSEVAIRQVPEADQATEREADQAPILGYISYEDLHAFTLAQTDSNPKSNLDTRLWNILQKKSSASRSRHLSRNSSGQQPRGQIDLADGSAQVFKIAPDAVISARVSFHKGQVAKGYELNLDTLDRLVASQELEPLFFDIGEQTVGLAKLVVEARRQSLEQQE